VAALGQSRLIDREASGGMAARARLWRREAIWGRSGIESSPEKLLHGGGSGRWGTAARGPVWWSTRGSVGSARRCGPRDGKREDGGRSVRAVRMKVVRGGSAEKPRQQGRGHGVGEAGPGVVEHTWVEAVLAEESTA
jgi:hypothetical protein